jgi:hypothetical protein
MILTWFTKENHMPVSLLTVGIVRDFAPIPQLRQENTMRIDPRKQTMVVSVPTDVLEWRKGAELTKGKVIPALLGIESSSSDDIEDAGFPFSVPDELTESQAKDLSRVLAQGVPDQEWIEAIRAQLHS